MEEEIYTEISYREEKRYAKVTASGSGNYCCVPKCIKSNSTKLKIISNQMPELFSHFPESPSRRKQWLIAISRYRRKERTDRFKINNALVCEFHFNPSHINMSIRKGK